MAKKKRPDPAHLETDKIIERIEKEITEEYRKAHEEVTEKWKDYLRRFEIKDKKWREWVESGKKTQDDYTKWRKGQIMIGKRWEEMKDVLAEDYANAAEIADSIANGYRPEVYAINHNYTTFEIEQQSQLDTSYTLYSRESVERMYRDNPKLYHDPGKDNAAKLAKGEIKAWNKRKVQSVITQGILQGESIPQLTKRLERVTGGAHAAAIRNARTMMTGTQNAGRIDAKNRAKDMGIPVKKQWLATLDTRTRIWHRELDGKIEDIDKPFENSVGKIMFPGDPDADGANIYCCRCTLLSAIKGFEIDASDIGLRHNKNLKGMTYEQWKNEKKSTSNPITLPEEKAKAIKGSYVRQYSEG